MSSDNKHFFEGAEKLLEVIDVHNWLNFSTVLKFDNSQIWFDSSAPAGVGGSLRQIPRAQLELMVNLANAHIVSSMSNARVDSYVLSESSLFVSDRRLLLKTCGTTTLLTTVEPLLRLAATYAGLDRVVVCWIRTHESVSVSRIVHFFRCATTPAGTSWNPSSNRPSTKRSTKRSQFWTMYSQVCVLSIRQLSANFVWTSRRGRLLHGQSESRPMVPLPSRTTSRLHRWQGRSNDRGARSFLPLKSIHAATVHSYRSWCPS